MGQAEMKLSCLLGKSSCLDFSMMWYRFAQPDLHHLKRAKLNGLNSIPPWNFILFRYNRFKFLLLLFFCFRVLEASLAENKSGLKRKRGDPWVRFVDPVNPYERQRQDGCPVGLKNVGNTCWFSAVIQVRRDLVLNF